jgi:hypothetical protein
MLVKEKVRVWVLGPEQLEPRDGLVAPPAGAEEMDCTIELLSMNQVRNLPNALDRLEMVESLLLVHWGTIKEAEHFKRHRFQDLANLDERNVSSQGKKQRVVFFSP